MHQLRLQCLHLHILLVLVRFSSCISFSILSFSCILFVNALTKTFWVKLLTYAGVSHQFKLTKTKFMITIAISVSIFYLSWNWSFNSLQSKKRTLSIRSTVHSTRVIMFYMKKRACPQSPVVPTLFIELTPFNSRLACSYVFEHSSICSMKFLSVLWNGV